VRTAEYVRRTIPRFPRQEFTAALFVATQTTEQQRAARGRTSVRVVGGMQLISQARRTSTAYDDEGFDDLPPDGGDYFTDKGTEIPATFGAGVHYALRPRVGVDAQVMHTVDGWLGGLDQARGAFSTNLNSTEGAVLATYAVHPYVRVGLGPGFRQTRWTYYSGFTQGGEATEASSSGVGAVGSLSFILPAGDRGFGELSLRAANYMSEKTPTFGAIPSVAAGRTYGAVTLGFGMQF
jgi:hypothetical protein